MTEHPGWLKLLEYARWAPSPHNIQPWRVNILTSADAELYYEPNRLLPQTDPTGRFMYSSFGIFCEYLAVAANSDGYTVEVEKLIESFDYTATTPQLFAKLHLVKNNHSYSFNRELLLTRRTNRLPYDGKVIDKEIIKTLSDIAKNYDSTLTFSQEPIFVKEILNLNQKTLFYDMKDPIARSEVGTWIRYSQKETNNKKDGLSTICLGFPSVLLRLFMTAPILSEIPGIKTILTKKYLASMDGTTTIGWINGPFQTHDGWFKSGRLLAQLWLTMAEKNIYLHPFGSIITNPVSNKELQEHFHTEKSTLTGDLWLIFRLGYSQKPPQSSRREVSDILIK